MIRQARPNTRAAGTRLQRGLVRTPATDSQYDCRLSLKVARPIRGPGHATNELSSSCSTRSKSLRLFGPLPCHNEPTSHIRCLSMLPWQLSHTQVGTNGGDASPVLLRTPYNGASHVPPPSMAVRCWAGAKRLPYQALRIQKEGLPCGRDRPRYRTTNSSFVGSPAICEMAQMLWNL